MPQKTPVTCSSCSKRWQTRTNPPTEAKCPQCGSSAQTNPGRHNPAPPAPDPIRASVAGVHPDKITSARSNLERVLISAGYTWTVLPWMERGDKLYEAGQRRILTDDNGVFLYGKRPEGWKRFKGCVHFDRAIIRREFEKWEAGNVV